MTEVFDVFVMPSRFEGLPLVLIEAQAAGLACVVSDAIAREAIATPLVSGSVSRNLPNRGGLDPGGSDEAASGFALPSVGE
jgi:glycosyltransferase involved in cell wall biosynthesis